MPTLRHVIGAAALVTAGPAAAEGFSVADLAAMPSREACMARAAAVLDAYMAREGGYLVQPTEWVVYAWDLGPGDNDVALMCAIVGEGVVNAFLVVHGETADADRELVATTIEAMWAEQPKGQ